MTLVDFDNTFVVTWASGWRREIAEEFIRRTKGSSQPVRVCTVSTQHHCVSLVASNGTAHFEPYEYSENQWRKLYSHRWRLDEFDFECLKSDEEFKAVLEHQMLLQFPDYTMGYYDDFPTVEQIKCSILDGYCVDDLRKLRYSYYEAEVQRDPEWDGAIQILCEGGWLLIPYFGDERYLIPRYATFVPESVGVTFLDKFGTLFDRIVGFIGNLHWSDFRRHIDELGGNRNV